LLVIVPPLAFVLKDIIATVVLLATEPGITAKAVLFYHIALIPGILWFDAAGAMLFNFIFGVLVGVTLYLCVKFKKIWLLILPLSLLLVKDIIALTITILSTQSGITVAAKRYYYIAMLPGSLLSGVTDPTLANLLFGAALGGDTLHCCSTAW
jgi:hypothetical protein